MRTSVYFKINSAYIIFLLLMYSTYVNAQRSVSVGSGISNCVPRGFDIFASSYNYYHSTDLKNTLSAPKNNICYNITFNQINTNKSILSVSLNGTNSKTSVDFYSGDSRYFNINTFYAEFAPGYHLEKNKFGINGNIGFMAGFSQISSYYRYNSGLVDFSAEKRLNGSFSGIVKAFTISLKPHYRITPNFSVYLLIKALKYYKPTAYNDKDGSKKYKLKASNFLSTDYIHITELYEHFNNEFPDQYILKTDIRGLSYQLGISYHFNNEENKKRK